MSAPVPMYEAEGVTLYLGDCDEVMAQMPEASVDAVVTDPPYGLEFMGKDWDQLGAVRQSGIMQDWHERWAREALRVLKPGGWLIAFGGTRTSHRLVSGIEDAGFEIRDSLVWLFGSGFPKSLNLDGEWEGWGTALKPAHEPIVLARKLLTGTAAQNVLEHGTGALNIEAARIGGADTRNVKRGGANDFPHEDDAWQPQPVEVGSARGRWPANVILDPEAAAMLDAQAGQAGGSFAFEPTGARPQSIANTPSEYLGRVSGYGDSGGPSRFFYCAKAGRAEREAGLESLPPRRRADSDSRDDDAPGSNNPRLRTSARRNDHPTVKPLALMRWLVSLVLPPGGVILDPFVGSGTTGMAVLDLGGRFIGIDQEGHYLEIAQRRIAHRHLFADDDEPTPPAHEERQAVLPLETEPGS